VNTDSDRWSHILQNLTPNYFKWKDIMENGPRIYAKLIKTGRYWTLAVEEDWQSVDDAGNYVNSSQHDNIINWADEELKKWKCRRTAWHMWEFQSKREAEKFITFYNLRWA